MKTSRKFFILAVFLVILICLPVSCTSKVRGTLYSALSAPIGSSHGIAGFFNDLVRFRANADDLRKAKRLLAATRADDFNRKETQLENERLTSLLGIRKILPQEPSKIAYARVFGRSDRSLLVDKGSDDGIRLHMPVLSDTSLVGKIIEVQRRESKVVLLTDPNSKVGALIQRTRQQGVVFGNVAGECRMKYLSVDTEVKPGDVVETVGMSGVFPKGLPIGTVTKVWREPGQIYQVAELKLLTDLTRLEEVACVEP